jgi:hypothetical protein
MVKQLGLLKKCYLIAAILVWAACASRKTTTDMNTDSTRLHPKEAANGYVSLFDGKTLNGWRTYQNRQPHSWVAENGVLHCKGSTGNSDLHADLVTNDTFENFELALDWKLSPKGNSGIMYLVTEDAPAAYESGPEYQLLDDAAYAENLEDWQKTGANYAMHPAPAAKPKAVGEWNHTRIVVNKGHVEHWLNGDKIVEYELWSEAWQKAKAAGKWKDTPGYGMAKSGRIALQDHGSEAWFRNIRIRKL